MPRLWKDTIETHRRAVRDATVDAAASLIAQHGLRSVTMSDIAEQTGIGRATLYKYFSDVEEIARAWHDRQIARHLEILSAARDKGRGAQERLGRVLQAYALIHHDAAREHVDAFAALVHGDAHAERARSRIRDLVRDLIVEAANAGTVRRDIAPDELADYCVSALGAAGSLRSKSAVHRLVSVTLAGLSPAASTASPASEKEPGP